ncbi:MAG: metal-dependent hydrolase [Desulfovibrio sp.]|nr:metal-dependent hydrolase [Desulfovibrio sp.]
MKWMTHQAAAVGLGLALHLPPAGIAAACFGAILPDVLDQRVAGLAPTARGRQRVFNRIHRGTSHWLGWWLVIFLAVLALPVSPPIKAALSGLAFGAASHVLLDMLTPQGVPWHPFSRKGRFSFKLCSTGSLGEYCFLALLLAALWLFLGQDVLLLLHRLAKGQLF